MRISRLFRSIIAGAKVAVVLLLLIALCAAGADAARRTDAESRQSTKAKTVQVSDTPHVGAEPAPETPGGNMTPNSRPTTEQHAILSAVIAPAGQDRSLERINNDSPLTAQCAAGGVSDTDTPPIVSLAQVAPDTAELCTLVGAVPSGTM